MPNCPHCQVRLQTVRQRKGIYFFCEQCSGRAVTIPQVRRVGGDPFATTLLRQMRQSGSPSRLACPFCARPMRELATHAPALELDACRPCNAVWFDPLEFESLPEQAVASPNALRQQAAEAIALQRIREQRTRGGIESDTPPDEIWKWLPALFGMPVEMEGMEVTRRPWLTWGLCALILVVSLLAFRNLEVAVHSWGMIPAEWWRYGGFTLFSSFLLHGGVVHLLGNLYFLLVFGDNVEDYLGRWRTLLLLVAAAFAGDMLHILLEPRSTIPCIGASGGISGIIVFYAAQFPRARLGLVWRYYAWVRWISFPAWAALLFWITLQSVGAWMQMKGLSNVSALAHLGGAAVGFVAWLLWHRMESRAVAPV